MINEFTVRDFDKLLKNKSFKKAYDYLVDNTMINSDIFNLIERKSKEYVSKK